MGYLVNLKVCPCSKVSKQKIYNPLNNRNYDQDSHSYRVFHDQIYILNLKIHIKQG